MSREWSRTKDVEGGGGSAGAGRVAAGKNTSTALIQRRADVDDDVSDQPAQALVNMSTGGGAPLPDGVRGRFEQSLGADLGAVRVHTGGESASAARSVNAQAFTVGNDIHFGAGRYQPDDPFGMHLLAHEVAHTQQQAGGSVGAQRKGAEMSTPGDASEREADVAAVAMVRGAPATVSSASAGVQRWGGFGTDAEGDDFIGAATADPPKPVYLKSYLSGREFPWELLPKPREVTLGLIQQWIDFYGLSVYGMPNLDNPRSCTFNGSMTDSVKVTGLFMKEAKAAGCPRVDAYAPWEVIHKDQEKKYEANEKKWKEDQGKGGGGGGGAYNPGAGADKKEKPTYAEIEWELTPFTAKKTWGGETEVEGPKHQFKGQLFVRAREVGSWKAEVTGSGIVEFEGGKLSKVGTEIEGKLSREFLTKLCELELVAKVVIANDAKLREGQRVGGTMKSDILKTEPSAEANIVYTIPGTDGRLQVKGGVSADPEGISLGASFTVKWQ